MSIFKRVNCTHSDVSKILGLQVYVILKKKVDRELSSKHVLWVILMFLFSPLKVARGQAHSSRGKSLAHGP